MKYAFWLQFMDRWQQKKWFFEIIASIKMRIENALGGNKVEIITMLLMELLVLNDDVINKKICIIICWAWVYWTEGNRDVRRVFEWFFEFKL